MKRFLLILLLVNMVFASKWGESIIINEEGLPAKVTSDSALYVTTDGDTSYVKIADTAYVRIASPLESNGAVPVNVQDQHSKALDLNFIQSLGATTLGADASPEDRTITLTDATGFIDGDVIGIFCPSGVFYFGQQIGAAAGNVITLDTPIDRAFLQTVCTVIRATKDLAVDGSGTTQVFQVGPVGAGTGVELDITRIHGYLQDGTAMDDAKFGGVTALTYGIVLRQNDGVITNLWNAKTNGELSLICGGDFTYTTKAPAGSFGARFRNTYSGQEKHGVTIRLEPGDVLQVLVQDNLSALETFHMMAQGHIVTD